MSIYEDSVRFGEICLTYNPVFEGMKPHICTLHILTFFDVMYNVRFHVFKGTIVRYIPPA